MTKKTARDFWRRYLGLICNKAASTQVQNPSLQFMVAVKAGELDEISDQQYNELLRDCEEVSAIWHMETKRRAEDIFLDALKMTEISKEFQEKIADLLTECSLETNYLSEEEADVDESVPWTREELSYIFEEDDIAESDDWSPRHIYDYLCERIQGQEEAKKTAAMITYNHVQGRRSTAVFCGPSGCGKSEIWRQLSKDYPRLIRMVDASRMAADGWKGSIHLRDIFEGISESDIEDRGLIVVLDEADKICCESAVGSGGTNYNTLVQNSLLKMLDGDVIEFGNEDSNKKAFKVDCSRVSVVLLGAFEQLLQTKSAGTGGIGFGANSRIEYDYSNTKISYEDLIAAGMRREIAGRINRIVALHPLSVSDYKALLTGPLIEELESAGQYKIILDDRSAEILSEQASKMELGVRWMRSQIINALDDLMFEEPEGDTYVVNFPSAA